jgi:hypothetical protein
MTKEEKLAIMHTFRRRSFTVPPEQQVTYVLGQIVLLNDLIEACNSHPETAMGWAKLTLEDRLEKVSAILRAI